MSITSILPDGIVPEPVSAAKSDNLKPADLSKTKIGRDGSSVTKSSRSKVDSLGSFGSDSIDNGNPVVINGLGVGLKFSVDKETNTRVIEVVDLKTGVVIRQIPPKEVVNFLRAGIDKGVLFSGRF